MAATSPLNPLANVLTALTTPGAPRPTAPSVPDPAVAIAADAPPEPDEPTVLLSLVPEPGSIAAYKAQRAAEKATTDAHLRQIGEAEAAKQGRDPITSAYLRTLPVAEQRKLLKLRGRKFEKAMQALATRAHRLHDSGAFVPDPDLPPAA